MSNKKPVVRKEVFGRYTIVGKRGQDDLGNAGWKSRPICKMTSVVMIIGYFNKRFI